MREILASIRYGSFDILHARETGDEVIIEATATGEWLPAGTPFHMRYVVFVAHRDGRVTHVRDYMNPLLLEPGNTPAN